MTSRERWIVYPLLSLALGVSLKDKIFPPSHGGNPWFQFEAKDIVAGKILCTEMQIISPKGNPVVLVGVDPNTYSGLIKTGEITAGKVACSRMEVLGPGGKTAVLADVDPKTHSGRVETLSSDEVPLVQLHSNEAGGYVTAFGQGGKIGVMAHTPKDFGLFLQLPRNGGLVPLSIWPGSYKIEKKGIPTPPKQAPPPPQEKPPSETTDKTPAKEGSGNQNDLWCVSSATVYSFMAAWVENETEGMEEVVGNNLEEIESGAYLALRSRKIHFVRVRRKKGKGKNGKKTRDESSDDFSIQWIISVFLPLFPFSHFSLSYTDCDPLSWKRN
jgi:hypothetical protein